VGPEDYRPSKERETGFSPISVLQQGLKNMLELEFQLDAVDYSPANFVHADMTPDEFAQSMEERGESLLSIMWDMMASGMRQQAEKLEDGEPPPAEEFDLVSAFRNREGRHLLRTTFAKQLEEIEVLAAGGENGTLLVGRNEKCLKVLAREIAAGHKKIGIYYGAAHLPHMEKRLVEDMGFRKTGHEWLVAWDCSKRPDPTYDRALVKQRRQCKAELKDLAAAAQRFRREARPEQVVTVKQLAETASADAPYYSGPAQDPWGRDYVVRKRPTGSRWEVSSVGPDGVPGTDDDLVVQEPSRR
jgi:hypothetical protein